MLYKNLTLCVMIYAGLAVASTADGDGNLLDCDPMTRAICAVHGKQMLGASKAERLRHLQHVGDLDGQPLTEQLVYDIVAEASFKSIVLRAGFQKYAWILDAKSYFQLKIPKTLESRVARPLSALGQIVLTAMAACAKVHGASMAYISEEHFASLEVFQQHFISCKLVRFFEAMFSMRCMVKHTPSEPVVLRRVGMEFTLKDFLDHMIDGKYPIVLPLRFDEKMHEFSAHNNSFMGALSYFFSHDCFAHGANITYADMLGQSYFSNVVATQSILNKMLKTIALQGFLDAMSPEFREKLHDIDEYLLGLGLGYHYTHEGVLVFPSTRAMKLQSKDVDVLFCSIAGQDAPKTKKTLRENFRNRVLQPAAQGEKKFERRSNAQSWEEVVSEWCPKYRDQPLNISPDMIMEAFDNMNEYVFEKNGFHIFATPKERSDFEASLRRFWEKDSVGEWALHPSIDFCIMEHDMAPTMRVHRLVMPKKQALLSADPLIIKHMLENLFVPHYIWFRQFIFKMAGGFRAKLKEGGYE